MKVTLAILFAACVVSISGHGYGHRSHGNAGHSYGHSGRWSGGHGGYFGRKDKKYGFKSEVCDVNKKEHKNMCTFVHNMCGTSDTRFVRKQTNGTCAQAVIPQHMKKKREVCLYNSCKDAPVTMEMCKILNMSCHHEVKKLIPLYFIHRGTCGNCSQANLCRWRKHKKVEASDQDEEENEEDCLEIDGDASEKEDDAFPTVDNVDDAEKLNEFMLPLEGDESNNRKNEDDGFPGLGFEKENKRGGDWRSKFNTNEGDDGMGYGKKNKYGGGWRNKFNTNSGGDGMSYGKKNSYGGGWLNKFNTNSGGDGMGYGKKNWYVWRNKFNTNGGGGGISNGKRNSYGGGWRNKFNTNRGVGGIGYKLKTMLSSNKSNQLWKKKGKGRKICASNGVEYASYCEYLVGKCQAFKKNMEILYIQRRKHHRRGKPEKCARPKMKDEPERMYFFRKFVMRKLH